MSAQSLTIDLDNRSYDIVIGDHLLTQSAKYIAPKLKQKRVVIITDLNVAPLYGNALQTHLEAHGIKTQLLVLPAGEKTKSFIQLEALLDQLLSWNIERGTTLIALGGGVIGDLTGFAASIVLRGISFIQCPTTLLAQVDSSVGGKTGINTAKGKNLVGSFYQPQLVLADTGVLKSLPPREMLSGYAEIVKYGLINKPGFFDWLEQNGRLVLSHDTDALTKAIHTSCASKASIVAADERESNVRALLNFGHTFGHALEAETGFSSELLHGEAVAMGMVMAFEYCSKMKLCSNEDAARAKNYLNKVGLRTSALEVRDEWNIDALMHHFQQDKKVEDGKLTFILTKGIGKSYISQDVSTASLREYLALHLKIR